MTSSVLRTDSRFVPTELLEFVAFITAVVATAFVSFNIGYEFMAFVLYGVSNIAWFSYALNINARWLLMQNVIFMVFTINGLINFWPAF